MVIRMNRSLRSKLSTENFNGSVETQNTMDSLTIKMMYTNSPVADDFIDIHVALSPRASLPHHQWKVVIKFPIMDFSGCPHYGIGQFGVQSVMFLVHSCTGLLQISKGMDDRKLEQQGGLKKKIITKSILCILSYRHPLHFITDWEIHL